MTIPDPSRPPRIDPDEKPAAKLRRALRLLKEARTLCRSAGAPKAYERCRQAIASAEGAKRHAEGLESRQ